MTEVMPAENTATPGAEPVDATATPVVVEQDGETEGLEAEGTEAQANDGEGDGEGKPKAELTPEQKEIYALKRRIGRMTNEKAILKAEIELAKKQTAAAAKTEETNDPPALTEEEVERRAGVLAAQREEQRELSKMVDSTITAGRKAYKDFDALTAAVDEEIGGFADRNGRLRPLTAAIFDAEKPHELIKYLADNPEIASDLAGMAPIRQIRRIAQIEIEMGKASKPKPSSAPKPITPVKGSGVVSGEPDPKDAKAWIKWRNENAAR